MGRAVSSPPGAPLSPVRDDGKWSKRGHPARGGHDVDTPSVIVGCVARHVAQVVIADVRGWVYSRKFTCQTSTENKSSFWQESPSYLSSVALQGIGPAHIYF